MIPRAIITQWRQTAPWPLDYQVEQDLVLTRVLVEIYSDAKLSKSFLLRGGTALNKLLLTDRARYSEDIDLVQIRPEPIGKTIDQIRERLDAWLGTPKRKQSHGLVTLAYRFDSEPPNVVPLRLKIEINTREHTCLYGTKSYPIKVDNRWYKGEASITTYTIEELLATKLRALYQRRKGRDLFDFFVVFRQIKQLSDSHIIEGFKEYVDRQNLSITREDFLSNLELKLKDELFLSDINPIILNDWKEIYSPGKTAEELVQRLIEKL